MNYIPLSKTPQQLTNNFTRNGDKFVDKDAFNDREFTRDFKSIKKLGSVRDEISEKRIGREKEAIFAKSINQK